MVNESSALDHAIFPVIHLPHGLQEQAVIPSSLFEFLLQHAVLLRSEVLLVLLM